MLGYLVEYLIENYHDIGFFILNGNELKMYLKDVALISGLKVVKIDFRQIEASNLTIVWELKDLGTRRSIKSFLEVDSLRIFKSGDDG